MRNAGAAGLMLIAMAIIGVIDTLIIRLAETVGLWQFHVLRSILMAGLIAGLGAAGLGSLRPVSMSAVALRSLLVATGLLFYFAALAIMPVAQALAGLFTSPIFILILTALFRRQRIGPWRVLSVLIGFGGVLVVLGLDSGGFDRRILLPVIGGFFYALGAIATREMCAREDTLAMLAGLVAALGLIGAGGVLVLAVFPSDAVAGPVGFAGRGWVWAIGPAVPWIVLQAVGSTAAVFLIIRAYQTGEPSRVSVFEYSVMIFGPLFAWVALGQSLDARQMAGIVLIVLAGTIIALRSRQLGVQVDRTEG